MEYTASLDKGTKVMTAAVGLIVVVVAYIVFFSIRYEGTSRIAGVAGFSVTAVVLFIAFLYAPQRYTLTDDELIIHRRIGKASFKRADIKEVRTIDAADLRGVLRTFGSGGYFGYFGKFYSRKLGHMTWYATQRRNAVFIETNKGKKILLSPDDLSLAESLKASKN